MLILSKKFISLILSIIGNVLLNDIIPIVARVTTDIVRVFLSALILIKNIGNKMLTIIIAKILLII